MKKFISFLLVAVMLVVCGGQRSYAENTDYVPQRSDYSFRSDVRTVNEDGDVRWDTIIVYLTDAKGHTQELYSQALPLDTLYWNKGSIGEILEDDWNFDGIPDLQVCTGPMNGFGNYTYPRINVSSVSGGLMMMWKSYDTSGRTVNSSSQNVNKYLPVHWQMTEESTNSNNQYEEDCFYDAYSCVYDSKRTGY